MKFKKIEKFLCDGYFDIAGIHGIKHWNSVRDIGLMLAKETKADITVIKLFALFHDSMRIENGNDIEHGERSAELLLRCRNILFKLTDIQFEQLYHACKYHTTEIHNSDITIGTCYDADRLDLIRFKVDINPLLLNTEYAKSLIINKDKYIPSDFTRVNIKEAVKQLGVCSL